MPIESVNAVNTTPIIQKQPEKPLVNNNIEQATDNNNHKTLIGVGAALALVTLGVLGHKGYLGEGIQKALGGAKKAAKEEGTKKTEEKAKEDVKKTFKELYNDAIKEKKASIKNEITGRTHSFEYAQDGTLIKETVTKGDDYVIYMRLGPKDRNIEGGLYDSSWENNVNNGKMRIVEVKKGETISLRHFNEDGTISYLKPEVPVKAMPRQVYNGELPKKLPAEEIPERIDKEILENWPEGEKSFRGYTKSSGSTGTIYQYIRDTEGNITKQIRYNCKGGVDYITKYTNNGKIVYNADGEVHSIGIETFDTSGNKILEEVFGADGKLDWFEAISKDNQKMYFRENGEISTNLGPGESLV